MKPTLAALLLAAGLPAWLAAQGRGAPAPPRSPKEAAPVDLTGYWVSIVSEDWRWRMVTPPKGDTESIPLNPDGKKLAAAWDPEKDQAAGMQCKSYGAPAIMRVPGRIHITWADDQTLKIDTDAGTQTRLFHFGGKPTADTRPAVQSSLQGYSAAKWEGGLRQQPAAGAPPQLGERLGQRSRSLEVVTTNLNAGYLRKNGVPYSANVKLTEYYDLFKDPDGTERITVTTIVNDPEFLLLPFVTTSDFKKEPDGSKWDPSPCAAK
jgi:hypothetical protein